MNSLTINYNYLNNTNNSDGDVLIISTQWSLFLIIQYTYCDLDFLLSKN